jgi:phage terminase small subunit
MIASEFGRPLENGKHEHFAHLVAKGESAAKAYVLCGYSEKGAIQSGNRLLRKPEVAARVKELKTAVSERRVEKVAVDRAWALAMLVENAQRAMQVEPVRDREGSPTGHYTYQGAVANKALELLGRELGMFQPQTGNDEDKAKDLIERLRKGQERVARAKLERAAASSNCADSLSRESETRPIVNGEKPITTEAPVASSVIPPDLCGNWSI